MMHCMIEQQKEEVLLVYGYARWSLYLVEESKAAGTKMKHVQQTSGCASRGGGVDEESD
jgi:hypothetical protein